MSFGIGLGSFLTGAAQGANAMAGIQNARSRQKLTDMQVKNLEDEQAMKAGVKDIYAQGTTDAAANTDGQIDNVMKYIGQNTIPKVQQYYMQQGRPELADGVAKWYQDRNVQQGARYGAAMMRDAMLDNYDGAIDNFVKAYNQPGYFDDNKAIVGQKRLTDKDGNLGGIEFTLKDGKTGKESTYTFKDKGDFYNAAIAFSSPEKVFQYGVSQLEAGQKANTENAKAQRDLKIDDYKANRNLNIDLEKQNNASQLRRAEKTAEGGAGNKKVQDAQAAEQYLRSRGVPEERIKALAPTLVGVQNQSAPMSKRLDDYIKSRNEDFTDKEWKKLSAEEQTKQALDAIQMRDKLINEQGVGLPGQQQPQSQQGGGGALYLDTRTGNIISR